MVPGFTEREVWAAELRRQDLLRTIADYRHPAPAEITADQRREEAPRRQLLLCRAIVPAQPSRAAWLAARGLRWASRVLGAAADRIHRPPTEEGATVESPLG